VTSKAQTTTENSKFTSYKIHHQNVCEIVKKTYTVRIMVQYVLRLHSRSLTFTLMKS